MKKILCYIFMLTLFVGTGIVFTACGDDENEVKNKMIVGVWTEPYNEHTSTLTLSSNGTFDFYIYGSALTGKGNYTYDEVTRTLSLFYTSFADPKNAWGNQVYFVRTLTDNYLVITDKYLNTHSFTKSY